MIKWEDSVGEELKAEIKAYRETGANDLQVYEKFKDRIIKDQRSIIEDILASYSNKDGKTLLDLHKDYVSIDDLFSDWWFWIIVFMIFAMGGKE